MKFNIQTIILLVCIGLALLGFLLFSKATSTTSKTQARIVMWGSLSGTIVRQFTDTMTTKEYAVQYVEKSPETFERDLLEALAAGNGPDLFIVPVQNALGYRNFIFPVPYQSYPRRNYENTFIEEAQLFLSSEGVYAFPFLVDPLVLYYNRDIFSSEFLTTTPQYWDEFLTLAPKLTKKTASGAITQSAVPLGTYDNVLHAKDILATFMLQSGNPLIARAGVQQQLQSVMNYAQGVTSPIESALRFYTSFADRTKENYSWNASLPDSQTAFISGDAAVYIGFASELGTIRLKNPNLNFDVILLPQTRDAQIKATYGSLYGVAVSKGSKNIPIDVTVAANFTSKDNVAKISNQLNLPPVRKDLLAAQPESNTYVDIFYKSAIISRGWLDPSPTDTDRIFKTMIDSTNSGAVPLFQAATRASADVTALLAKYNAQEQQ